MKRLLFLTHRWVGIVAALLMVLWFSSGLVIVLSGTVPQSRTGQLAHTATLNPEPGWLALGEAWQRSAEARAGSYDKVPEAAIADARLLRVAGEPQWLVEDAAGRRFAVSAVSGELRRFGPDQALRIAREWLDADRPEARPEIAYLETLDAVSSLRNYPELKPFHRIAVADGAGTELLISARSGEVLQAATGFRRSLYLAGNWVHLFRPLDAVGLGDYRRNALIWAGFIATVGALTGIIVGWLRWRPGWFGKPTYAKGYTQPYQRSFFLRWHFWSGLVGGIFILLWAFSGFLTGNPGEIFSPAAPSREELARYQGAELPAVARDWRPETLPGPTDAGAAYAGIVELDWRRLGDQAVLLAYTRDGSRLPQTIAGAATHFDETALLAAVRRLAGDVEPASWRVQEDYDSYYYPNHYQDRLDKPLPVLAVELGDAGRTRLYLDPQDGRLLARQDSSRRAYRWLVLALHHWDFGWIDLRPIWDGWILTWVSFGLVLSTTSVVIGWRHLRRKFGATQLTSRRTPGTAVAAVAAAAATES
jgi:uncharacterized iron-regulated membrane protein